MQLESDYAPANEADEEVPDHLNLIDSDSDDEPTIDKRSASSSDDDDDREKEEMLLSTILLQATKVA